MKTDLKYALPNMFSVGKFMTNIELDFIFSCETPTPSESEKFLLLNNAMAGNFEQDTIQNFIDTGARIVIISNQSMTLFAYNIDEDELTSAIIATTM